MGNKLRHLICFVAVCVVSSLLLTALVLPFVGGTGLAARAAADYWNSLPSTLVEPPLPQASVLLASDGKTKLATLFLYNREAVPLTKVAPVMVTALISVEDSRFYSHPGVDVKGIARALDSNVSGGEVQGASTLTQQYVKNTLLLLGQTSDDKQAAAAAVAPSVQRKLKEAKLALNVDAEYSKDQILEKYLNIAYFGAGAYGVEAASRRYFGVHASQLTLPQAALISGLVKNPSGYDPTAHPKAAKARRDVVLSRMHELGKISNAQYAKAKRLPLGLNAKAPKQGCEAGPVPFYCDWVLRVLEADPSMGKTPAERRLRLLEGGLVITTAIDMTMQKKTQKAVHSVIGNSNRVAASAVVVEPGTGRVKAMAVNRDYGTGKHETEVPLMTKAAYQSGSTFKAYTLAAALERGIPLTIRLKGGNRYTSKVFDNPPGGYFKNDADGFGSNLTLNQSIAKSVNTSFVQLEEKVGTKAVADAARRAGVTSLPSSGPNAVGEREGALTLGTREVSPLDMAVGYATFAAHGKACPAVGIIKITDRTGKVLSSPSQDCHQVFDPGVADTVTSALRGVLKPGGTGVKVKLDRPAAGKTGTTDNLASAWFIGYTPQLVTAVALADPRGAQAHPLHNVLGYADVFGGGLPGQIWHKAMTSLLKGKPKLKLATADPSYMSTSSGPLMPSVVGQARTQAEARLRGLGLKAKVTESAKKPEQVVPAGTVLSEDPSPGDRLKEHSTVKLTVAP